MTRAAAAPVPPGEVVEYVIEVVAVGNLVERGHRICLDITSTDVPTGVAGATNAEYVPYHLTSAVTTLHHVHHNTVYPSALTLPVIPLGEETS